MQKIGLEWVWVFSRAKHQAPNPLYPRVSLKIEFFLSHYNYQLLNCAYVLLVLSLIAFAIAM